MSDIVALADSGQLWAQRMMVGALAIAAEEAADPVPYLDTAIRYARTACSQGDLHDLASALNVLMKRGALPDGEWAGGEAIARMEAAARAGDETCAAELQTISDKLPPDVSRAFFSAARSIMGKDEAR